MNRNYLNVPRMARILCALPLLLAGWSATACETEVPRRVAGPVTTLAIPDPCPDPGDAGPVGPLLSSIFLDSQCPIR